jgi:glycosyltransferase involved in cell wall biosynthesis
LYSLHDTFVSAPIKKARIAIAVSEEEAKHYEEFGVSREKIRIVPNGIDLETFSPGHPGDDLTRFRPSGSKLIGYVGRLDPIKGLLVLLKAFESICHETPGTKLVLIGPDFGMRQVLASEIRRKGMTGVMFLDPVANDRLPNIYRALDVIVTPSFFEIFGMSTLEAMACGRPVVSTSVGGVSDLIQQGRNGLLVPPGDHRALASKVNYLLQNESAARLLGDNARLKALGFGIERTADLTEEAYHDCIRGGA